MSTMTAAEAFLRWNKDVRPYFGMNPRLALAFFLALGFSRQSAASMTIAAIKAVN